MRSEFRVQTPNIRSRLVIGFFATVLIIFLSVVFRFEFGIILLAVGGTVGLIGLSLTVGIAGKVVYRFKIWNLDIDTKKQELRLITAQADKATMESYVLSFPSSQRQLVSRDAPVRLIEATSYKELPAGTEQAINLLDVLCNEQRVLIKGASNAGKTTLLQWIASRKVNTSQTLVIDPHASPEKWQGCQVIGLGSNHAEIETALDRLIALMVKRYQDKHKVQFKKASTQN